MEYFTQILAATLGAGVAYVIFSPKLLRTTIKYRRMGTLSQIDRYFASSEGKASVRSMRLGMGTFFVYSILQRPPILLPGTIVWAAGLGFVVLALAFFLPLRSDSPEIPSSDVKQEN